MKLRSFDSVFHDQLLQHDGLLGPVHFACAVGQNTYAYLRDNVGIPGDRLHATVQLAHDELKNSSTGNNENTNGKIYLTPDSHTQTAGLTWSADVTHLIGMYPKARTHMRSRIGHSANFTTLLTVSGFGNLFQNLYFQHGRGSATNLNLLSVTGHRNTFRNCSFSGPFHATEGGTAGYDLVRISGTETFFDECWFGADTIDQTTVTHVEFASGATRTYFRNCVFIMRATGANPVFFKLDTGGGNRHYFFENCRMLNIGSTSLTLGITWDCATDATTAKMFFDAGSYFSGVTDVVKAAAESRVFFPVTNLATGQITGGSTVCNNLFTGLATNPDVS